MKSTALGVALVAAAATFPPAWAQEIPPPPAAPGRSDNSPEALMAGLLRSLERGEAEHALTAYESLLHVTGMEDTALLGQVARASLVQSMERGRGWLQISAARSLAVRGNREALEVLRKTALGPGVASSHRVQAIDTLGLVGDAESIPALQKMVYDAERPSAERLAAATSLLNLGDVSSVLYLKRCIQETEGTDRLRAMTILSERKIAASEALRQAARQGDAELRFRALQALALQGDREAIETLRHDFDLDEQEHSRFEAIRSPETEGALEEPDPEEVQRGDRLLRTGMVLLQVGDKRPIGYFTEVARNPDPRAERILAAREVARVDPALGRTLLREVVEDGLLQDRVDAAQELVKLGETEGMVDVVSTVYREGQEGDRYGLRLHALIALGRMKLPGSQEVLREALGDSHVRLQIEAARSLAGMGDLAGVGTLRHLLDADDPIDALKAAEALMEIGDTPGQVSRAG